MKAIIRAYVFVLLALSMAEARAQILTTVHDFSALVANTNSDGAQVRSSLLPARDGSLYGTSYSGGTNGTGTVFKFTPGGDFRIVHTFGAAPHQTNSDGDYPQSGLVQDSTGDFFGMTAGGGAYGYGTVFRMTASGAITLLHSFNYSDGENPVANLTPAGGGNFYGLAPLGGINGQGSLFRVNTNGAFQSLHDFAPGAQNQANNFTNFDGYEPYGTLLSGGDGYLYGTTEWGGTNGNGTVFRFHTNNGAFNVLHTFGAVNAGTNSDGVNPLAGLTVFSNGVFWGTASYGGKYGYGTIFQITTGGVFTVLHAFNLQTDGGELSSPLIEGRDGNYYGVTDEGDYGAGTIFQITTNGALATLHTFSPLGSDGSDGGYPYGGLALGGDGYFYGTTQANGAKTNGTIFRMIYPGLAITGLPGKQVLVSWPTNQAGFALQVATNLASPIWVAASPAPVIVNDQFCVTNSSAVPKTFYRLKK